MSHTTAGQSTVVVELTIPGDARLVETVHVVAVRVAAYVGYSDDEAGGIGWSVSGAMAAILEQALHGDVSRSVTVAFRCGADEMEIELRCTTEDDLPLQELRGLMPPVAVVRESGASVCRLRCPLP